MKFLNQFFTKHPELRDQYVNTGIIALNYIAKPIDLFMQHLLVVQNIDPKTKPGERYQAALNASLDKTHEKDFDDNYDFSWLRKSFQKTQKSMPDLKMSPAQYHRVTDIGDWQSPTAPEDEFFNKPFEPKKAEPAPALSPTIVDDLLTKEGRDRLRQQVNATDFLEHFRKSVDRARDKSNETHKEVQLEKKDPETLKKLVTAIKEYNAERDAEKVFKKMAEDAVDENAEDKLFTKPDVSNINSQSLKEALQTIVKLAKSVEGPVKKVVEHRDGNSLVRKEKVEKGFIKRFPK